MNDEIIGLLDKQFKLDAYYVGEIRRLWLAVSALVGAVAGLSIITMILWSKTL